MTAFTHNSFRLNNAAFVIAFVLALIFISGKMSAQTDGLEPGIYAVVNEEYIPLKHVYGGSSNREIAYLGVTQLCPGILRYKGMSSGIVASDTFLYVLDPEKKVKFSPFNKIMNPKDMRILPLDVDKEKQQRVYIVEEKELKELSGIEFEWKELNDYVFEIHVPELSAGEYGIIFRREKYGQFDYTKIFCFTVPE